MKHLLRKFLNCALFSELENGPFSSKIHDFCVTTRVLHILPISLEEKKTVKIDINENNMSLGVFCGKSECKIGHPMTHTFAKTRSFLWWSSPGSPVQWVPVTWGPPPPSLPCYHNSFKSPPSPPSPSLAEVVLTLVPAKLKNLSLDLKF